MRFILLAMAAAAAVAAPLEAATSAACDAQSCADMSGNVQCALGALTDPTKLAGCITGDRTEFCACVNCAAMFAPIFAPICGSGTSVPTRF